jgi:3-hydroxybutyryl-CoA dehydrogenase
MTEITKVGVIGAGTMGSGIAQVCAIAGLRVAMVDVAEAAVLRGLSAINTSFDRLIKKEKMTQADKGAALERIDGTTDYDALKHCDLIIEAASENEELKLRILKEADERARPGVIIASNTSSLSITKLAAATSRPAKFIGVHFFNPVPVMALVELTRGLQTDDATVETAKAFVTTLGKTPIVAKNSPGFIVNRLLCPMINEAVFALQEGLAPPADIDEAMKLGCGHQIGPLALADLIGLDVVLAVMDTFYRDFDDPKYRPALLLKEMVAAGHLGRKTSRGFFTYA